MSVTLVPLYPEAELQRRVAELAVEISRVYADTGFVAVVVMNGGLFFAADLLRRLDLPVCVDSLAAGSYLHHASTGQLAMRGRLKLHPTAEDYAAHTPPCWPVLANPAPGDAPAGYRYEFRSYEFAESAFRRVYALVADPPPPPRRKR